MNYITLKRLALSLCCIICFIQAEACTSAVISAAASASGRPMLWKHRDTSNTDNVVEYIPGKEGEHSFVALFNAEDTLRDESWIGMNDVGFAVMNTASYNLKNDNIPMSKMDKEGYLMTIALKSCTTVEDFATLLDSMPRPMGVEANFGVIDAYGEGAFFETNNDSYIRFSLKDAAGGVLIRTNYSHSGRQGEGYGYIREANAIHLLEPYISSASITPELLTENISRNFYHDVHKQDDLSCATTWLIDEDYIPRYKSTATVVIEGITPLSSDIIPTPAIIIPQYIMWTGLGYPPCSEIVPAWCHKDGVDPSLRATGPDGTSPKANLAKARRNEVFSYPQGIKGKKKRERYINPDVLKNQRNDGYIQTLIPENLKIYTKIKEKRDRGEIKFL